MSESGRKVKVSLCVKNPSTGEIFRGLYADARKRLNKGWSLASKEDWKAQGRKMLPAQTLGEK